MDFIPRITPRWKAPLHLKPYIDALEKAPGGNLRLCFSAPPQHSKSESASHAFVWWALKHPALRNAYATYSTDRAQRVARNAAGIAERAGLQLVTANLDLWRTREGGQTLWTSVGGPMTGEPIDGVLVIDDAVKDRKEAESPTIRQNHKDWFHSVAETRIHPDASIIAMMTRWHNDDLVGYLVKECGFTLINLKAIADENRPAGDNREVGEPLWPWKHPLESLLEKQRNNPWNFASMYQGEPRPRGSAVFKGVTYYHELPENGFRIAYGCDLAYSEKKTSKWSVCVELWAVPPPRGRGIAQDDPLNWKIYVVDVQRKQVEPPEFGLVLKAKRSTRRGRFFMYGTTVEEGGASFFRRHDIPLTVMSTGGRDKFQRAMVSSEMWNAGCIMVPADSEANPWVDVYVDEMTSFTGVKDPFSDQVDGTVSGIDALLKGADAEDIPNRSGGRWS